MNFVKLIGDARMRVHLFAGIGKSVAAHVATTKDCLMVNNLNDDARFADGTGWNERLTTSIICVPIISLNEKCCAVIELRRTNAVDYKKVWINRMDKFF